MTEVEVGLVTTLLGDNFRTRPNDLAPEDIARWWARTDYGWNCGACPFVGVNYTTFRVRMALVRLGNLHRRRPHLGGVRSAVAKSVRCSHTL